MSTKPSTKIEEKAVRVVEDVIDDCELLKADIKSNDKSPSWDGNIYVYSNPSQKKEFLNGIIPVQVKGKTVKQFSGNLCSYPIEIVDLRNYQLRRGIIYFVVEINELNEETVYYETFLPFDLKKILEKVPKNQKTKCINLKHLRRNTSLNYICLTFNDDIKKQIGSSYINEEEIESLSQLKVNIFTDDLEQILFENEFYLYGQRNETEPFYPIKKIHIDSLSKLIHKKVSINGKVYFNNYSQIVKSNSEKIIQIGSEVFWDCSRKHIEINLKGSLKDRLSDARFFLDCINTGYFEVDGLKHTIISSTENNASRDVLLNFQKYFSYLNRVENAFAFFNINCSYDLSELSKLNPNGLLALIEIAEKKESALNLFSHTGTWNLDVGPLSIGMMAFIDDNQKNVYNLFSDFYLKYIVQSKSVDNSNEAIISIFMKLKSDELVKYTNFDADIIKKSILDLTLNDFSYALLTLFLLEVIKAYDINNSRKEFFYLAEKIVNHLLAYDSTDINNIINQIQLIKRTRTLNKQEKSKLLAFRNSAQELDYPLLCAISILLDNVSDYEYYYDLMSKEDRKIFCDYPIYNLKPHSVACAQ